MRLTMLVHDPFDGFGDDDPQSKPADRWSASEEDFAELVAPRVLPEAAERKRRSQPKGSVAQSTVDLTRIRGIGNDYSRLLAASGVDTVKTLSQRNPTKLLDALVRTNKSKSLVGRVPSLSRVEGWVRSAQTFDV